MKFNFKKWPVGWINMDKISSIEVQSSEWIKQQQPNIEIEDKKWYIMAERTYRDNEAKWFFIDYKNYSSYKNAEKALDEMMFTDSEEEASREILKAI